MDLHAWQSLQEARRAEEGHDDEWSLPRRFPSPGPDTLESMKSVTTPDPVEDPIQRTYEPNVYADQSWSWQNTWTWRCLGCDSQECVWTDAWKCANCGGSDFYQTDTPAKKLTDTGTWMYLPHGLSAPPPNVDPNPSGNVEQQPPGRRRRRRRQTTGHGDDPSSQEGFDENQPSEIMTNDTIVDPDTLLPERQGRPNVPRQAPGPRVLPRPHGLAEPSHSAHSHQDPILRALKQLVQSRDTADDDWNSQKGPSKGVRWKTGAYPVPPTWKYEAGDVRAFPKFEKKIRIWEKQMAPYASKADQALVLYGSLSGEPEQELEFLDIESVHTPGGIELILDTLRRPLEQKLVYQKRRFISEFENMRRYPTETLRAFINRFRRSLRSLKTVGINMDLAYDPEALGSRLLDRSGLSHESQRLLLVGTQQSLNFELLAEAMVLQWPDFRGPPPISGGRDFKGSGKGDSKSSRTPTRQSSSSSSGSTSASSYRQTPPRKQVYVAEAQSAAEDDQLDPIDEEDEGDEQPIDGEEENYPDEQSEAPDDEVDMSEIAEVLTLTAKKLSGITLGRKFSTTKPKPSGKRSNMTPDEAKKVTHCSACGALGHWHEDAECPMNKGTSKGKSKPSSSKPGEKKPFGNKTHSVGIIHHEHGSLEISDKPTDYGSMFRVNMVSWMHLSI